MTGFDIAHWRLHNQAIASANPATPGEVVRHLGAIQAQDYLAALWAVGLRTRTATEQTIEQAVHDKQIVRTWPMRGTLHFVAPEDVRWLLALLTPRIITRAARRHQQLELDEATFTRSEALFSEALQEYQCLTRKEMMAVLEQGGISTKGQRGYHLLWRAGQRGLICFGPRQGKQETFVLLEAWLPAGKSLSREESLAELAQRYFAGHGPATIHDFMWWSGLPAAEARAGLEMVKGQLVGEEFEGQTYWFSPSSSVPDATSPTTHLLPSFDEYLLGYKERSAVLDPADANKIVPGANGIFKPIIVSDGQVVGIWKRTFKKDRVVVTPQPFNTLSEAESQAVVRAAERYAAFVNLPVVFDFPIT